MNNELAKRKCERKACCRGSLALCTVHTTVLSSIVWRGGRVLGTYSVLWFFLLLLLWYPEEVTFAQ